MAGIAILARQSGYEVSGSDENVYPPMSDELARHDIQVVTGYDPVSWCTPAPDLVLVGNVLSRGNRSVEYLMNSRLPYQSGPGWLAAHILSGRRVLAVAGTHGKSTTASMLAWLLSDNGRQPGFLIGGVPGNFSSSAALGPGSDFVIEADEYDAAFFDKRAKFIHYRPSVLVLNNLEFDHADIYRDMADLRRQFHYLLRTVPANGQIVVHAGDDELRAVLDMGCWTPCQEFSAAGHADHPWQVRSADPAWRRFSVWHEGCEVGHVDWSLIGLHNAENALAAIAAAHAVGVDAASCCRSLAAYKPVRRRLQWLYGNQHVDIYDDFAHHPTAIRTTLNALHAAYPERRLIVALDPSSHTMRGGSHGCALGESLRQADRVLLLSPADGRITPDHLQAVADRLDRYAEADDLVNDMLSNSRDGDVIVLMSNGSFAGLSRRLPKELAAAWPAQTAVAGMGH